jgi:YggT family protein
MEATINVYINTLYTIYLYMVIGYILMSWIPNLRQSFIGELLGRFVEPYLAPFRKIIPPIGGVIDISPIVAIFALHFVKFGLMAIVSMIFG